MKINKKTTEKKHVFFCVCPDKYAFPVPPLEIIQEFLVCDLLLFAQKLTFLN